MRPCCRWCRAPLDLRTVLVTLFSFILGSTLMLVLVDPDACNVRCGGGGDGRRCGAGGQLLGEDQPGAEGTTLLILVLSGPDNLEQRTASRQTWLKHGLDVSTVHHYFVIGTKRVTAEQNKTLISEQRRFQDLLLLKDIEDDYRLLTRKVLAAFVRIEHSQFKYVLKCDDDTYVRVPDLIVELQAANFDTRLYWGFFDGRAVVKRTGRWRESDWFLCDHYLPYAKGGGYVLTHDIVRYIARNADMLKHYQSEDVTVGVWTAPLDIRRVHEVRFDTEYRSRGCHNSYLVTHKQTPQMMKKKHDSLRTLGRLCAEEVKIRNSYKYDWKAVPSQCCTRNDSSVP